MYSLDKVKDIVTSSLLCPSPGIKAIHIGHIITPKNVPIEAVDGLPLILRELDFG